MGAPDVDKSSSETSKGGWFAWSNRPSLSSVSDQGTNIAHPTPTNTAPSSWWWQSASANPSTGTKIESTESIEKENPNANSWYSSYYNRATDGFSYASDSVTYAADATLSSVTGALSSLYKVDGASGSGSRPTFGAHNRGTSTGSWSDESDNNGTAWGTDSSLLVSLQKQNRKKLRKRRRNLSPGFSLFQNPYQSVRGLHHKNDNSMNAIRNFLTLVPDVNDHNFYDNPNLPPVTTAEDFENQDVAGMMIPPHTEPAIPPISPLGLPLQHHDRPLAGTESASGHELGDSWNDRTQKALAARVDVNSETAAHLAEGTIRAWRDLALEEAIELNSALRFWSIRWDRPILSWLEAGPEVWISEKGYNHRKVGKRVAQIQAVLARRCAAIGELQMHLWRSGWQKGVAQWGVLGHGGQWATVAGFDGSIKPDEELGQSTTVARTTDEMTGAEEEVIEPTILRNNPEASRFVKTMNDRRIRISRVMSTGDLPIMEAIGEDGEDEPTEDPDVLVGGALSGGGEKLVDADPADVFVMKRDGGGTFVDDPAFLARWSVDAIALIRQQLFRAANGSLPLPYATNWTMDTGIDEAHDENLITPATESKIMLPLWAIDGGAHLIDSGASTGGSTVDGSLKDQTLHVMIADLPLMSAEVSDLVDMMEEVMEIQRERRLSRLEPPPWYRRSWYIIATGVPFTLWLLRHGRLQALIKSFIKSADFFFKERIQGPLYAIFEEVWRGRVSFSDKKARYETIEVLKSMIRSFLDENHPKMPESERQAMANAMDVSLVEKKKEEAMKSVLSIFDVVQMSFIEMQWLKKEMMNALDAMDEVMSANDINMNIAAITPVAMLIYGLGRVSRYILYSLIKFGRSKEETYAHLRSTLLDIERLLVMRDNPPDSKTMKTKKDGPSVLNADDLGMLMLLIHECRTILWKERRRFSANMLRAVLEDLSELAGERGAVSVQQQLRIISRMSRTYKVLSTGHFMEYSQLRTQW